MVRFTVTSRKTSPRQPAELNGSDVIRPNSVLATARTSSPTVLSPSKTWPGRSDASNPA
jgi:hypothetical protein